MNNDENVNNINNHEINSNSNTGSININDKPDSNPSFVSVNKQANEADGETGNSNVNTTIEDNYNEKNSNAITQDESPHSHHSYSVRQPIDIKRNRYPYSIVWTPLPCISWFLPFIGHTGICG